MQICVFSSSSDIIAPSYFEAARDLGREIGRRGDSLVYGGCAVGLMGAVAEAAKQAGARVVGVIPDFIRERGLGYESADEMIVTATMRERKREMEERADAFLALPGGFGTLEEMLEIITLKQLSRHAKPVIFLNTDGFYDPLAALFEHMFEQQFAKQAYRGLYEFVPSVAAAFEYLDTYTPPVLVQKWFNTCEP